MAAKRLFLSGILALGVYAAGAQSASADAYVGRSSLRGYNAFVLACENGHNYALRARAVSQEGDLVTGFLMTAPQRAIHVRLVPMGIGYRYAGHGVWLDGVRGDAMLNFGKNNAVACTVSPA